MQTIYQKTSQFVSRSIGGEVLLVPIRRKSADLESIYTLNETAAFIWEEIDGKTALAQILNSVESTFEVSLEDAEADLIQIVDRLLGLGAIAQSCPLNHS